MRNLQAKDLFDAARVVKFIKPHQVINEVYKDETIDKTNARATGIAIIFGVLEHATEKQCEDKIFEFLSGPMEMTAKEVAEMDHIELIESIFKIASLEKWKDFLSRASKLMS